MRVMTVNGQGRVLQAAFNEICDTTDWKNPIDALVPYASHQIYTDAVRYMTGTECAVYHCDENHNALYLDAECPAVRIVAAGYYAGPCS